MAETKKNAGLGIQETKGSFQLRGITTGVLKDSFYKEIKTKTDKQMRMINFGVNIDKDKTVYVGLSGMERDTVFFSKSEGKGKDRKTVTEKVAWKDRLSFKKEGFRPIGVNLGIVKTMDTNGNEVNDKQTKFEYDACKYISDNLKDDVSVFVKGKLEFSTYNDSHQTRYTANQISLCKLVDFDADDFKALGDFEQVIIFMGIAKNENGTFTVSAKIVTYNSVEDTELIVENPKLAKTLKTLKPYTAVKVYGHINVQHDTDVVEEEDDGWGESNPMERVNNPTVRTLVITGADKNSVDTDTYSEEIVEEAIAKMNSDKNAAKDFGDCSDDDWGSMDIKSSDNNDEDEEW